MFTYQISVSQGMPLPCTQDIWNELINRSTVINTCAAIAALNPSAPDYNDRKQALKKRLPIIIPHAASFANGKRISADATPSGLAMLDVDHVDNPREWFDSIDKQLLSDNKIYLVAITASGKGLRLIGERLERETIEAAQLRMAYSLLGGTNRRWQRADSFPWSMARPAAESVCKAARLPVYIVQHRPREHRRYGEW